MSMGLSEGQRKPWSLHAPRESTQVVPWEFPRELRKQSLLLKLKKTGHKKTGTQEVMGARTS